MLDEEDLIDILLSLAAILAIWAYIYVVFLP